MIGGYCGALAVVSALWQRARTGAGQWIDLSQLEALTAMIGVPLLEVLAGGQLTAPFGNRSMERPAAPHGIYRCRDREDDGAVRDRWCAIAVFGEEDWQRFVAALNTPRWSRDPRFDSADSQQEHLEALDACVEAWTRVHTAEEVMARLQEAGIAAGVVADGRDLCERDPQLAARRYWRTLVTPEDETVTVDGPAVQLSATPGDVDRVAPRLGEDTDRVLRELLGLDPASIGGLRRDGIVA
jgi:crotonobetainyl-CoA:carnitine CoA-transferase CaiB-like acyl-CoA transferase